MLCQSNNSWFSLILEKYLSFSLWILFRPKSLHSLIMEHWPCILSLIVISFSPAKLFLIFHFLKYLCSLLDNYLKSIFYYTSDCILFISCINYIKMFKKFMYIKSIHTHIFNYRILCCSLFPLPDSILFISHSYFLFSFSLFNHYFNRYSINEIAINNFVICILDSHWS